MADHAAESINRRRVLVTGASSQIGVFAIPRLLDAGFHVVAVSRQSQPLYLPHSEQLEWLSFDQAMALQNNNPCKYLLSAGPMSLAVQVLRASKVFKQAVIFSSSSVITKQDSPDPKEKQLIRNMREREAELQTLAQKQFSDNNRSSRPESHEAQPLKMVIFRPTLIYGCGLDENISRLAALINRHGFMPVNGKADGLRQPVHADDLAQAAVSALVFKHELPPKLILTGGSTISYSEMVEAIFKAFKKPPRMVRIPQWLLVMAIRILKPLGLAGGVSVAMVKRQLQDLEFDNSKAQQLLDFHPRPFAPRKKDFALPPVPTHHDH